MWDEILPTDLNSTLANFPGNLMALNSLRMAWHILKKNTPLPTQMHIYSDASERSFGAEVYLRATVKYDTAMTCLLGTKFRVACFKKQMSPKLELCAALLDVKLYLRKDMPINELQLSYGQIPKLYCHR